MYYAFRNYMYMYVCLQCSYTCNSIIQWIQVYVIIINRPQIPLTLSQVLAYDLWPINELYLQHTQNMLCIMYV